MDNLVDTDDEDFAVEDQDDQVDQDQDDLVDSGEDDEDDLVDTDDEDDEVEPPRSGRFRLNEAIDHIIAREASRSRESETRDTKRARL